MNENQPYIVLVEDNDTMAEVTRFRLELLGYRVRVVTQAAAVMDEIQNELPDAVIVDLEFNESQGFQVIESLGLDEATTHIPIMALSADAELDTVQRAFRAGAIEYLVAPYNPLVLEAKVEQLAALSGKSV